MEELEEIGLNLEKIEKIFKEYILSPYKKTLDCKIKSKEFKKNILDPFALKFANFFSQTNFNDLIISEIKRQTAKSIQNKLGLFHQHLFSALNIQNCKVPKKGWDVECMLDSKEIKIEIKNKHNTMNSSSLENLFSRAKNEKSHNPKSEVWLVEVISKKQGISDMKKNDITIKRVSIDYLWYKLTNNKKTFRLIWDYIDTLLKQNEFKNAVVNEEKIQLILRQYSGDDDQTKLNSLAEQTFAEYFGWK